MDAELAGGIGCGRYNATLIVLASDYNGFAFQGRIEQLFDGDEEGVHVHVKDRAHFLMVAGNPASQTYGTSLADRKRGMPAKSSPNSTSLQWDASICFTASMDR